MSFPRYPEYKDSGVEWLGEVPTHWRVLPTKRGFTRLKELNTGMTCENRLALTMAGVVPRSLDDLEGLQASEFESYQIFEPNDLAFKLIDLQNIKTSRVGLVPELGIMSPAYIRLEPHPSVVNPKFAYWFFTDLYNRLIFNQLGGGVRQTIGHEELLTLAFLFVPLSEQRAVAAFLDRETAKIDALVAEQERLIELLKEKRQAVISHAVTKGLDPTVPMKDSGIEWLGEVPAHWRIVPIKHLGWLRGGAGFPHNEQGTEGEELDFHKVNALAQASSRGVLQPSENTISRATAARLGAYVFPSRTIVFAKVGAALFLGRVRELGAPACIDNNMMGLVIDQDMNEAAFVRQAMCLVRFDLIANPGAVPSLNESQIGNYMLASPPLEEQAAIVAFLEHETAKIDALTADAEKAIDLLKERRSALISAAVTGKIDVRGLAARHVSHKASCA